MNKKTNTQKTGLFNAIQLYYKQQQSHEARRTDILLSFYQNFLKFNPQYKQNWLHKNVLEVYTLQLQNV
jgi:hypothetical protein